MSPMLPLLMLPMMMVFSPLLLALTGGSFLGVLVMPLIPLAAIFFMARRRRGAGP